jgi:large subunit ribosomal protein L22
MIYTAKHRYADVAPRKMRPFAQHVRGKNVDEALEQLRFFPNRGARLIEAVIKSAVGNAEDQGCRNIDDLVVTECRIDGGPMYKRIQPRARGTAFGIQKKLSHIVVALTDMAELEELSQRDDTTTPEPANQE